MYRQEACCIKERSESAQDKSGFGQGRGGGVWGLTEICPCAYDIISLGLLEARTQPLGRNILLCVISKPYNVLTNTLEARSPRSAAPCVTGRPTEGQRHFTTAHNNVLEYRDCVRPLLRCFRVHRRASPRTWPAKWTQHTPDMRQCFCRYSFGMIQEYHMMITTMFGVLLRLHSDLGWPSIPSTCGRPVRSRPGTQELKSPRRSKRIGDLIIVLPYSYTAVVHVFGGGGPGGVGGPRDLRSLLSHMVGNFFSYTLLAKAFYQF